MLQQGQLLGYGIRLPVERQTFLLAALPVYFTVNFLVRMALPQGLELDEAEQAYFSQWLLSGYSSQPPLYNWLQYGTVQVFGLSLATLSILKGLLLLASYIFYWMAARQVIKDRGLAIVATFGLLTIPQVAFEAQRDLSHTVATIFTSALFLYSFFRALNRPSIPSFLLLGLATGLGVIAKYNFVLLPVAAFLAIASDRTWRLRLLDWRLLIAGAVAFVIAAPHAMWLTEHFMAASAHTMRKLTGAGNGPLVAILGGLGSLGLAAIGFGGLTAIIFTLAYREKLTAIVGARSDSARLVGRMLVFALGLIVLMVLFAGVEKVRDRWLTPVLLVLPLYLAVKVDASALSFHRGLKRIWGVAVVTMVLIPTILTGRVTTASLTGLYQYPNYPFAAISNEVRSQLTSRPTAVVTLDTHMAGNLRVHLQSPPVLALSTPIGLEPPPLPHHDRLLFVWRATPDSIPSALPAKFERYLQERGVEYGSPQIHTVALPYTYGRPEDRYIFAYAAFDIGGRPYASTVSRR
ncbi:ArnT family glycosyltransferase [Rhizobium puerariae]|uniref:ArnT family glycosyltransferase n=1 Tax=Rhizobium puerariae TaxID=1585791 RepID=A0ABV6AKZ1_9HYPH